MHRFIFLLIGTVTSVSSFSQLQVGVFGGISNYQGDLVEKPYRDSRMAVGLNVGYQLSGKFNLRAGLTLGKVSGADSLLKQPDLKARNLSFQSPITEFSVIGEYLTFDMESRNWSPYLFAGVAVYKFNPYTFDRTGNKVFLQPLSTEGQGFPGYGSKPYSLTQLAIPFGGGIKYAISENVRASFEVGMRKLFTDFIDDVSGNYADAAELLAAKGPLAVDLAYRGDEIPGGDPVFPGKGETRGSPKYKDYYYFTGFHLTFFLPEGNGTGMRSPRGKKGYGCPVF